jgi:hypothetical protein
MVKPTGISRRLMQCVTHLRSNDCEGALVNLFPAMDKTAKKRRPKDGVGKRIKAFLTDEEALISAIGKQALSQPTGLQWCFFQMFLKHKFITFSKFVTSPARRVKRSVMPLRIVSGLDKWKSCDFKAGVRCIRARAARYP